MDGSGWGKAPAQRDRGGRFAPGVSGNPAGKRRGTLNRMTRLKLALATDESGEIARVVVDRALAGDMVAARFCLQQILPKKRGREIELDLPDCNTIEDILAAFSVTVAAMAAGEITPDEALTVSKVLDRRRRALEARARQEKQTAKNGGEATQEAEAPDASATPVESPEAPATPAPAVAPRLDEAAPHLHFACNISPRDAETTAAATGAIEPPPDLAAMNTPPRPPFPTFASACISPVITRRPPRAVPRILSPPRLDVHAANSLLRATS
ncbi:MAG: hypothetical protein JWL84_5950 [Rhodospirillales bacterium]|jgi:hypothetical protein|nr:hypothetical protein [Rhodospirillales bacterium]